MIKPYTSPLPQNPHGDANKGANERESLVGGDVGDGRIMRADPGASPTHQHWVDIHHHHACAQRDGPPCGKSTHKQCGATPASRTFYESGGAHTWCSTPRSWQGSWKPPSSLSTSTSVRVFVLFEDKDTFWHLSNHMSNYGTTRSRDLMSHMMFSRDRVDLDKQPHGRPMGRKVYAIWRLWFFVVVLLGISIFLMS